MSAPEPVATDVIADSQAQLFTATTSSTIAWWIIGAIVAVAAAARIWTALDELWLDEIWTLFVFAAKTRYPWDVFTYHHDNNHYLITLWMYAVGTDWYSSLVYRMPSLVAGVGTVALAAKVASRWGNLAACLAATLTGASHFLIFFAAQARGYALAGCFALVAFLALDRYLSTRSRGANVLFVVATLLGIVSHLTFIEFYFAAIIWSTVVCCGYAKSRWQAVAPLLALHAVPLAFFAALYLIDVRALISSPDPFVLSDVLARTSTLALGGPTGAPATLLIFTIVTLAVGVGAIYLLSREEPDLWIFFAAMTFFVPAVMLSVLHPVVLYERFFYINIVFYLLAASFLLSRLWNFGFAGRSVVVLALAGFVLGNVSHVVAVVRQGRSHHREALAYIAEHSAGPEIHIADIEANLRTQMYVSFYQPVLPAGRKYIAEKLTTELATAPEWLLFDEMPNPAPTLTLENRPETYRLSNVYSSATLEGATTMTVYHRDDAAASESVRPPIDPSKPAQGLDTHGALPAK
ncbi:MAG TPA: hypothetical protein VGN12_23050 [Pirellulales bacterium]|jgi:uncharacterized membrane protein